MQDTKKATMDMIISETYVVDFPVINPKGSGVPCRFCYLSWFDPEPGLLVKGCVKVGCLHYHMCTMIWIEARPYLRILRNRR
mgnify:CR=1 FL=1